MKIRIDALFRGVVSLAVVVCAGTFISTNNVPTDLALLLALIVATILFTLLGPVDNQ